MSNARDWINNRLTQHSEELSKMSADMSAQIKALTAAVSECTTALKLSKEDNSIVLAQILTRLTSIENSLSSGGAKKTSTKKATPTQAAAPTTPLDAPNNMADDEEEKPAAPVVEKKKRAPRATSTKTNDDSREFKKESDFHKKVFFKSLDEMKTGVMGQQLTKAETTKLTELFEKASKEIQDSEALKNGKTTEAEIAYKILGKNARYKKYVSEHMAKFNEGAKADTEALEIDLNDSEAEEYTE